MLRKSKTAKELGEIVLSDSYRIVFRLKKFEVFTKEGEILRRGPCLSLQLFHERRFLKAISIDIRDIPVLREKLEELEVRLGVTPHA